MATAKKNPAAAGPADRGLRVVTKMDGFRRAGRVWNGSTTVPLSELTPEQVELIEAEPMFITDQVDIQPAA